MAGWSRTTADDDTVPVSGLANVADRARAPMAAVRLPAAGPAHRSKGLSEGAAPSGGAGLVMVNPAGTSVWASSARRASTAGDSPGRAVVVVAPGALPVVADVGGAVVAVLDGSGGGGAVSGLAASGPGPTASEWTAEWAPRAERAAARWTTPLPPQVAATVAAPRHRRPISRSCSTPGG